MSKPDKPKTPQSEKLSVKLANQMQSKGASISSAVSSKSRGDARRTNAGLKTSIQAAQMAEAAKKGTVQRRAARTTNTAKSSMGNSTASTFSNYEGGGVKQTQDVISRGISVTAAVANTVSGIDSQENMGDFVRKNQKKQAMMDAATGAGLAAAYKHTNKKDKKDKDSQETGGMSVTNADGSEMSVIVDPDDPLSRPLPRSPIG